MQSQFQLFGEAKGTSMPPQLSMTINKKRRRTMPINNMLNVFVLLCLGNVVTVAGRTQVGTAFTGPSIRTKRPSDVSTTTTTTTNGPCHCQTSPQTSLLRCRSSLPCFHFAKDDRNPEKKEHYNDALLNRIISGRTSSSSRWRKRTKRAAATLGIQRQHRTEQDYIDEQEQIYKNMLTTRPSVPPRSSTIFRATDDAEIEQSDRDAPVDLVAAAAASDKPHTSTKGKKQKLEIFTLGKKKKLTQEQHARAKLEWAARYTSIHTLRQNFGRNRNKMWGDFDTKNTRKLYHTLLPRALLGLYELDLFSPTDLAPLAFEARIAAKKYARERCVLPGRIAAMVYDGFRSWRTWGTWSMEGMSWEQIWNKYETQIVEEYMEDHSHVDFDELQEEITAQICLRILERSCITNEAIDRMFLEESGKNPGKRNAERDLARIKVKLDRDLKELEEANRQVQTVSVSNTQSLLEVIGCNLPASLPLPSLL